MNSSPTDHPSPSGISAAGCPVGLLSRAAASLNRAPARKSALREAMRFLLEETRARRCLIYLESGNNETLYLETGCDEQGGDIRADDRISRGVAGTVIHTNEPLLLNSEASRAGEHHPAADQLVNAVIAVPLRFNGTLSGVLYIDRLADRIRFSRANLAFACAFTEIIALALRHHPLSPDPAPSTAPPDRSSSPAAFAPIIGGSPAMKSVLSQAQRILQHDVPVLILGESGTGKELLAKAIHAGGRQSSGPYVPLNCTAVPGDLLESELFGHVRGAFTGAGTDRHGLLEEADGGTLFLDEVGDLAPATQAKLLRVLQEREYRRVGENRIRQVNFRLITATNRDLMNEVARQRFRLDLFYRIAVMVLRIPPLRERPGDLPLLVDHFCRRFNGRGEFRVTSVDRPAMTALANHPWPGNVRELENTIHSALVMMNGVTVLGMEHLPPSITAPFAGDSGTDADPLTGGLPLRQARERFDRRYVASTLERHNGNRTRTASALGISRQALLKMFKRLGLSSSRREDRVQPGARL
jgi:transcriptional regulator with GAF, ATPase, and Fis domain